jgi:predicted DNA-binding transcriptional regulator YafY
MAQEPRKTATQLVIRLHALLEALRAGSCELDELLRRLGAAYPAKASARRMLDRDLQDLASLGILVEKQTRPMRYRLHGGTPIYDEQELRSFALIRDTFGPKHPQAAQIQALIAKLTSDLDSEQQEHFNKPTVRRSPVQPAIDYSPYNESFLRLSEAISVRQPIQFLYRASTGRELHHSYVEALEIEFYDRHFYLVAYTSKSKQAHDFRIDRIRDIQKVSDQRLPPGSLHQREPISFRYRLASFLAQGEISQRFDDQRIVERLANGDAIIEAKGRSDFFIIQTLLRYRSNAELLEPAWLRNKMKEEVRKLNDLYKD